MLLALAALAAVLAGWSGRLAFVLAIALLVLAWLTAAVLFGADYRDADGFMDCWPGCTLWQDTVGIVIFVSPVLFVCVMVGRLAAWLIRGRINR